MNLLGHWWPGGSLRVMNLLGHWGPGLWGSWTCWVTGGLVSEGHEPAGSLGAWSLRVMNLLGHWGPGLWGSWTCWVTGGLVGLWGLNPASQTLGGCFSPLPSDNSLLTASGWYRLCLKNTSDGKRLVPAMPPEHFWRQTAGTGYASRTLLTAHGWYRLCLQNTSDGTRLVPAMPPEYFWQQTAGTSYASRTLLYC